MPLPLCCNGSQVDCYTFCFVAAVGYYHWLNHHHSCCCHCNHSCSCSCHHSCQCHCHCIYCSHHYHFTTSMCFFVVITTVIVVAPFLSLFCCHHHFCCCCCSCCHHSHHHHCHLFVIHAVAIIVLVAVVAFPAPLFLSCSVFSLFFVNFIMVLLLSSASWLLPLLKTLLLVPLHLLVLLPLTAVTGTYVIAPLHETRWLSTSFTYLFADFVVYRVAADNSILIMFLIEREYHWLLSLWTKLYCGGHLCFPHSSLCRFFYVVKCR